MGRGVVVKRSKLLEQLRELGATQKHVAVGVLGKKAQAKHADIGPDGAEAPGKHTVAEVAQWNHYGTSRIPARPFITLALEQHKDELKKLQARLGVALVTGKIELDQALSLLGEAAVGFIKQTIADGVAPANAPATIAAKGSSTPLINFGQLRGSIVSEVRESGRD
jgi:hypothetical protein